MSGAVNIAIEFCRRTKSEYHTLSSLSVSGYLVPSGDVWRGVQVAGRVRSSPPITWYDIQANILPLPVIPSSRVYLARPQVQSAYACACKRCLQRRAPLGERRETVRKNDAVVCTYVQRDFFLVTRRFSTRIDIGRILAFRNSIRSAYTFFDSRIERLVICNSGLQT